MISENDQLLIDEYLNGSLSPEKEEYVQKRITESGKFRNEVKLQNEIRQVALDENIKSFRKKLEDVRSQSADQFDRHIPFYQKKAYKVAASLFIIISFSTIAYINFFKGYSNDQIFDNYFQPYDDIISARNDVTDNEPLQKAILSYNKADYANSIILFEESKKKNSLLSSFYLGISHLSLGNIDQATEEFNVVIYSQNTKLAEISLWYKALAEIKGNRITEAKTILRGISDRRVTEFYGKKADELLKELE